MNKERAEREKLDWLKFGNETFTVEGGGAQWAKYNLFVQNEIFTLNALKIPLTYFK